MSIVAVQQAMLHCLRAKIAEHEQALASGVSSTNAAQVLTALQDALQAVGVAGLKTWLEAGDATADVLEHQGQTLRYKGSSAKEFLTPLGPLTLTRRLYQADRGGPCHVPLDAAWGMQAQFATAEVREAVAYAVALVTPQEAAELFAKVAWFQPGRTTFKKVASQVGQWFEEHPEILEPIRATEEPPEAPRVLCASLDGTNVRLAEAGPKPGRPRQGAAAAPAASCFKNAMVGSVTWYGEVPAGEQAPRRLQTRYVARMPEAESPTFRRQFEAEVAASAARGPAGTTRVLLLDAAKALWHYVETQPVFARWEKAVDFQHTVEHTAAAAAAVFGKGTPAARAWLERQRRVLLEQPEGGRRVLRTLKRLARRPLSAAARAELDTQRQFFRNNHRRMPYANFRARGLPIGSGPVEAAGKMLVKTRFCRSGMRWTRAGGQQVLVARTLIKSQRWDAAWALYLKFCQTA